MMLGFDEPLLRALFGISEELEPSMLANIAIVAQR